MIFERNLCHLKDQPWPKMGNLLDFFDNFILSHVCLIVITIVIFQNKRSEIYIFFQKQVLLELLFG